MSGSRRAGRGCEFSLAGNVSYGGIPDIQVKARMDDEAEIEMSKLGALQQRGRIAAKILAALVVALLASSGHARAANCYDLSKGEPHSLDGVLEGRIFPDSMVDVMEGRATAPGYILKLDAPICVTGQDADPLTPFLEAEVRGYDATLLAMRKLNGSRVHVELRMPYAAMTVHEHRPMVATVVSITAVADAGPEAGPGAAVTRAFYQALSAGRGDKATALIAPENRRGAFAPEALTRFYGSLVQRLKLEFVLAQGPERFLVRYEFFNRSDYCGGRAVVTTATRGAVTFIEDIRALDGC